MYFNSASFLWFFPLVALFYFVLPKKAKAPWLLICSYYFYFCFSLESLVLLVFITFASYMLARSFSLCEDNPFLKKCLLYFSVFIILGGLFITKYLLFFSTVFSDFMWFLNQSVSPAIPNLFIAGSTSYYTFQALGYVLDVYKGKYPAEKNYIDYSVFVGFFPTIVMGPIQRANHFIPQLKEEHPFEYDRVSDGLFTILWGVFKKLVIADGISSIVDSVYRNPQGFGGPALILATLAFAIQIYCDFSGYTDIAIGVAKIIGFNLSPNFNTPYFSTSVGEFWSRWHISLSTWFKDYVYIPLGGNRKGKLRTYINVMITFLVSGLWHGANWTYIVWGTLHGLYGVVGRATSSARKKLKTYFYLDKFPTLSKTLSIFTTFILICISWVFFRANSLEDAFYILTHFHTGFTSAIQLPSVETLVKSAHLYITAHTTFSYTTPTFWQAAFAGTGFFTSHKGFDLSICTFILFGFSVWQYRKTTKDKPLLANCVRSKPFYIRIPIYYLLLFLIMVLGNFGTSQFIYAQY